ncbi:basic salivary proline-rich protein 3 isoform X1 [Anguilla anguilla]|uniref:basic salivary proline-rich protein 3 isoform X1 n=2 Tax=Anguilla anguilla TaxID=7936 RepID=UPI0015A7EA9E|nr:basic salivary proline-rich protein 3 isoform X1 [Anguilla anguilla]
MDGDGDTYEAPPCERPAVKVPARRVEENVYLERSSAPEPCRQAPPPRPAKNMPTGKAPKLRHDLEETYIDPNAKKPPQVNREQKPGKKPVSRKTPPPRPGSAPAPSPAPSPAPTASLEDDVYLDPNEGQEGGNDDVYLEPNAACPPPPGVGMRKAPPSRGGPHEAPPPRGGPCEALPPRAGPRGAPYARGGPREAPPPKGGPREAPPPKGGPREAPPPKGGPHQAPPPKGGPHQAPPPKGGPREAPPPKGGPHQAPPPRGGPCEAPPPRGLKKSALSATAESQLQAEEWFAGNCDRKTAEVVLSRVNKDGAFLVRYSSAQNTRQPYTLVVFFRQKVYNIPIRYLEHTQGYALGKEGKKSEEFFSNLQEIISHHRNKPIQLIDSKSQAKHTTYLTHPARP